MDKFQENFKNICKEILSQILNKTGGILNSSGTTLRKGDFYILGVNPGGEDAPPTVGESIDNIFTSKENSYLDQDWSSEKRNFGIGDHPLQKNLKYLFDYLKYDLRNICSSNLIFVRTKTERQCDFNLTEICWNVHRLIIDIIKPSIILTFGKRPYTHIKKLHEKQFFSTTEDTKNSGHGKWLCNSFKTNLFGNQALILGLPHLSRYRIIDYNNDRKDILNWIKYQVVEII